MVVVPVHFVSDSVTSSIAMSLCQDEPLAPTRETITASPAKASRGIMAYFQFASLPDLDQRTLMLFVFVDCTFTMSEPIAPPYM